MNKNNNIESETSTWGPWLFGAVFIAQMIFFWWLLIYNHGVAPQHG
jgi:hypothetical protein